MPEKSDRILDVLCIPTLTEGPSSVMSLFDALRQTDYENVRKEFTAGDLVPLLKAHPELVAQWTFFSENKRCGGWWVTKESCDVGWLPASGRPFLVRKQTVRFASLEEAVAEFVVRELDDAQLLMNDPGLLQRSMLIQTLILLLLAACFLAVIAWLFDYSRRGMASAPAVLAAAREAVASHETWLDRAVFDRPIRNADGSWTVSVERRPMEPGGHRIVKISSDGKVKEYTWGR
jgi:hypothetical protein